MRLNGSRWNQIVLISLTIICALAVGSVTALLSSGGTPVAAEIPLPSINSNIATRTATPTVAATPSVEVATETAVSTDAPVDESTAQPTTEVAASAPQPDLFIDEDFSSQAAGFPTRETPTWSAGFVDQRYQLVLNGQTSIGFTAAIPTNNYRLDVDVAVEQGGAGVVFLYADPETTYRILITTDGAYALERQSNNEVTKLMDWTESPALQRGPGVTNRLRIERQGDLVRFFANDQPLTEYRIAPGPFVNRYGFVLTSKSGLGKATFDNLRGERLPNS